MLCYGGDFVLQCESRLAKPAVRVAQADNGYGIDHQLSYAALTGMGANTRRHGRDHVLGLTRAESAATIHVRLERLVDKRNGMECVSPNIEVGIAFKPMVVYIGREFPEESCSYREILDHEMRHVDAYRAHLPKVEAAVRARLEQRFNGQILYGRAGTLEKGLQKEIADYWLPLVDREVGKVEAVQALIDSPEEYDRLQDICGGELQRLMRARR